MQSEDIYYKKKAALLTKFSWQQWYIDVNLEPDLVAPNGSVFGLSKVPYVEDRCLLSFQNLERNHLVFHNAQISEICL